MATFVWSDEILTYACYCCKPKYREIKKPIIFKKIYTNQTDNVSKGLVDPKNSYREIKQFKATNVEVGVFNIQELLHIFI